MDDYSETEKKLKESADKVQLMDFETRWNRIKDRLEPRGDLQDLANVVSEVSVNGANEGAAVKARMFRSRKMLLYISLAAFLLCATVLAIVLPVVLDKKTEKIYFYDSALTTCSVTEEEYYQEIESAKLNPIELTNAEISLYSIFYTDKNVVKGASLNFTDINNGCFGVLCFYDSTVIVKEDSDEFEYSYDVNNINFKYNVVYEDGFYNSAIIGKTKSITYKLKLNSLENNITDILDDYFG